MGHQSAEGTSPLVTITGADAEQADFDVIFWDNAASNSSEAFIAALRAGLENSTIKKIDD